MNNKVVAGRYEIVGFIGQGAMGAVYKAKHTAIGRLFAVKMLNASLSEDERSLKRFEQEAQAMSVLTHPNLIAIADYGRFDDGAPFLVMEYLDGVNLSDYVKKNGPMPQAKAAHIFAQIADALAHAHSKQLIHRDLKPSNIMLIGDNHDFVKVVDLGIAKMTADGDDPAQHLTKTGEVFGSPLYMSPEQCMGTPVDARSDIYSFGCLMYEVLTGRAPLKGDNVVATAFKHLNEMPKPLLETRPDISPTMAGLIEACLQKDPNHRIGTMAELRDSFRSIDLLVETGGQQATRLSSAVGIPVLGNGSSVNGKESAGTSSLQNRQPLVRSGIIVGLIVMFTALGTIMLVNQRKEPPAAVDAGVPLGTVSLPPNASSVSIESPVYKRDNPNAPDEVDVVAIYAANANINLDKIDQLKPADVRVLVSPKPKPITLVLLSFMPVHWKVEPFLGAKIDKVIASGYFEQKISGAGPACDVNSLCRAKHGEEATDTANLFYTDPVIVEQNRERTYEEIRKKVKQLTGKEVRHFEGRYYGDEFKI